MMRKHLLPATLILMITLMSTMNAWAQIPPPLSSAEVAEAIKIATSFTSSEELYQRLGIYCGLCNEDSPMIIIQGTFQRTAAYVCGEYLKAKEARIPFKLNLKELNIMSQDFITVVAIAPKAPENIDYDEPSSLENVEGLVIQRIESDGSIGPFIEPIQEEVIPAEGEEVLLVYSINTRFHPWLFPRVCDIKITIRYLDGTPPLESTIRKEHLKNIR